MIEFKQGSTARLPVTMDDLVGEPITGVTNDDITVSVKRYGQAVETVGSVDRSFSEFTDGAFADSGVYELVVGAAVTATPGVLHYIVTATGVAPYRGIVKIVANEEGDTYTRIGAPVGASISADIAGVQADTDDLQTKVNLVKAAVDTNLDTTVGSRASSASVAAIPTNPLLTNDARLDNLANADVATSTRASASALTTVDGKVDDIGTNVDSIKADTDAYLDVSVSSRASQTSVDAMRNVVDRLRSIGEGRLKLVTSGTYANHMELYDITSGLLIQRWLMKDPDGNPTSEDPFERVPTL
jgi:hypothetical protein